MALYEAQDFVFEHAFTDTGSIRALLDTPFQIETEPSCAAEWCFIYPSMVNRECKAEYDISNS